jgi:hypothetical protein
MKILKILKKSTKILKYLAFQHFESSKVTRLLRSQRNLLLDSGDLVATTQHNCDVLINSTSVTRCVLFWD